MARTVNIKEMLEKMTAFNNQYTQVKQEILSSLKLNASTVNLISIIGDETMTLKEITAISELDKSTISRQINVLVREGLVLRETGQDKRFSYFELTSDAKVIHTEYMEQFTVFVDTALKGWSEEEKQMFTVLLARANYSFSNAITK